MRLINAGTPTKRSHQIQLDKLSSKFKLCLSMRIKSITEHTRLYYSDVDTQIDKQMAVKTFNAKKNNFIMFTCMQTMAATRTFEL